MDPKVPNKKLFDVALDSDFNLSANISSDFIIIISAIIIIFYILYYISKKHLFGASYEIDSAEFGLKGQKIKIRPNETDRQIAYQVWVELSTRKIGLEIDLEDDVIAEIYDSWYSFFGVTRELIKDVPVSKFRRKDTEKIIRLSIEVLNEGLRPHLTKWQARYRRWYDRQLKREENIDMFPQDLQKSFPQFEGLSKELMDVNARLIKYRNKMYELITRM